jgi:hypothetical protein
MMTPPPENTPQSEHPLSESILKEHYGLIGQFTDGIVHNLNNPLNAVSGLVQLMAMRNPDSKELDRLDGQIEILASMIRDLGQRFRRLHEPVSGHLWSQVIKSELNFFQAKAQIKHHCEVDFQTEREVSCPMTWPEATWLVDQILLTLVLVVPGEGMRKLKLGVDNSWPFAELNLASDELSPILTELKNQPTLISLLEPYGMRLDIKHQPDSVRIFVTQKNEA